MTGVSPFVSKEKNISRYKRLRTCFILFWMLLLLGGLMSANDESPSILMIWWLCWVVNYFTYLVTLGLLAQEAGKSYFLWVVGTFFTSIIGVLVSYFRIKTIAIENGWT